MFLNRKTFGGIVNRERYQDRTPRVKKVIGVFFLSITIINMSTICYGFSFDNLRSGQSLYNICEAASDRGQKLYKTDKGVAGNGIKAVAMRAINPSVKCANLGNTNQVFYGKNIFEKSCSIALSFTPKSQRLQTVKATWEELSLERLKDRTFDEKLTQKIASAITRKYGTPKIKEKDNEKLFESYGCYWEIQNGNRLDLITLDATFSTITVTYYDKGTQDLAELEKEVIKQEAVEYQRKKELKDKEVF
jgi:hypothetical protein